MNKLKKIGKLFKPATWIAKRQLNHLQPEEDDEYHLEKEEQKNLAQDILDIMKEMEYRSRRISALMKNLGSLRIVSIPEKPSYEEAKRARDLSLNYIHVDGIHVNRLIPKDQKGKSSYLDKIILNQEKFRKKIHKDFQDIKIWESNLLQDPPVGIEGLEILAQNIYVNSTLTDILNPLNRESVNIDDIMNEDEKTNEKLD